MKKNILFISLFLSGACFAEQSAQQPKQEYVDLKKVFTKEQLDDIKDKLGQNSEAYKAFKKTINKNYDKAYKNMNLNNQNVFSYFYIELADKLTTALEQLKL